MFTSGLFTSNNLSTTNLSDTNSPKPDYTAIRDSSSDKRRGGWRCTSIPIVLFMLVVLSFLAACSSGEDADEGVDVPTLIPTEPLPTVTPEPTHTTAPEPTKEQNATAEEEVTLEEGGDADVVPPNVYFLQPSANAVVPLTSTVIMGFEGVAIAPAGDIVEGSGHMHILIDTDFVPAGEVIINDGQHRHFGDGSTITDLGLTSGSHTLRLQFADGAHRALEGDAYRDEIVVNVRDGAPEQAVGFAQPTNGATVPTTFDVFMYATGLIVEPAGEIREGAGHMHILVDTDFVPAGQVIINDEQHLHFGQGQLQTELTLDPGEHTLRLQMADGAHIALEGDQYRAEVQIMVEEEAPVQQVYIVEPSDGAEVPATFDVSMSAAGLFVDSSGAVIRENGGHMHILIDTDFYEAGVVIPNDEQNLHFGGGQLATTVTLEPGEHTLRLQMADGVHRALEGEQFRHEITVMVNGETDGADDEETTETSSSEDASTESNDADEDESKESSKESSEESSEGADQESGEENESVVVRLPQDLWVMIGCSACHNINENYDPDTLIQPGPHQGNIYERAGERVEGQTAREYVFNSIVNPNDYVVEGYVPNVMPQNYGDMMSEDEIWGLVDWMLDPNREGTP
ncbi:MAG: DUF4399 domain-containing protein [Chloroflexota bacterium]